MKDSRDDIAWKAVIEARKVVKEHEINRLPVDPIAFARKLDIEVMAKDPGTEGVSGMLLRLGNAFGIAYATHIDNLGFQHFSVAHELGHYFLPGHVDAVFTDGSNTHKSMAGFRSGDRYESEADHFAAHLLMPENLFKSALLHSGTGLSAIEKMSALCVTSLTATAIRYAQCTGDAVAIVVSNGDRIDYCFISDSLKEQRDLEWIRKGEGLPRSTATFRFNQNRNRVVAGERTDNTCDIRDWFGGDKKRNVTEEVLGLGTYGRTLTVLTADEIPDPDDDEEDDDEVRERWTPRFRR